MDFYFNTILLCYNCRNQALVFIRSNVNPPNENQNTINLQFITCGMCERYPHVFNPSASLLRRYINIEPYSETIEALSEMCKKFNCKLVVLNLKKSFSIARLEFMTITWIENRDRLLLPDTFAVLDNEESSRFFGGDATTPIGSATVKPDPTIVQSPPAYGNWHESRCLTSEDSSSLPNCGVWTT